MGRINVLSVDGGGIRGIIPATILAALEHGAARVGRQFRDSPIPVARKANAVKRLKKRRKPRISAATRRIYQQQGKYLAALRPLSKAARAKVKTIRKTSGVQAAVGAARRMTGRRTVNS